jgi:phospholipid/cholesterol/gamma-HCH transport system ATP-binding protein
MIQVKNLSKSFRNQSILKDISIDFYPKNVNFIIGRSGQGKSVLTKCMVGLFEPDTGELNYSGENFLTMTEDQRRSLRQQMGMLFQGSALFDSMTVEDNILFPLNMFTNLGKKEKLNLVNSCLERVNLSGKNKLYPAELSGGMKKRTGIARAIVMNPKYLFVDEPNSGLDPETSLVIDKLIRELTYELGTTTVVVSHDMNSVMEIGDRINFIHQGTVEWKGNSNELIHSTNKNLENFVFASDFMQEIRDNLRNKHQG